MRARAVEDRAGFAPSAQDRAHPVSVPAGTVRERNRGGSDLAAVRGLGWGGRRRIHAGSAVVR